VRREGHVVKVTAWLVAGIAVLLALVAPTIASPASRLYLVLVAGSAALVGTRRLLDPPPYPKNSTLGGLTPTAAPQQLPEEFRRMAALLSRYRDPSSTLPLDPIARHLLRSIASQRLYQRHQLRLDVSEHLSQIQPLVSPLMWHAIAPPPRDVAGSHHAYPDVPASAIGPLIDELERI
jgi:hypothetical protein